MDTKEQKKRGFPVAYMYLDKRIEDLTHEELLEAYKDLAEALELQKRKEDTDRRILSAFAEGYRTHEAIGSITMYDDGK